MEALLSTHGGGFKTDFGLRGTIDFEGDSRKEGWNRLFGYINGTIRDERIDDAIEQRRVFKDQKNFKKKKLEPISPKVPTSPESKFLYIFTVAKTLNRSHRYYQGLSG